ncbi:cupin [Anopheles sinensis]|uniref:Cupin n=1 Tax=Anopheles sinensis TaxID=74873 RepID=A0A084W6Z8_ANOSI|nr:cupin [Anopheles sinensis]
MVPFWAYDRSTRENGHALLIYHCHAPRTVRAGEIRSTPPQFMYVAFDVTRWPRGRSRCDGNSCAQE